MMSAVAETAELVWGYTMGRIDRIANRAAMKGASRFASRYISYDEAREEAWQGIVDLLYLVPEKPSEWSLTEAGVRAVGERFRTDLRDQGRRQARGPEGGYEDSPRFHAYWVHIVGAKPDWTDAVIERMALPRVLSTLTPAQYEAVAALAAHGTMAKAANALNIDYAALKHRVQAARKRALAVWFEGETPPGATKADPALQCRYGHSRRDHGFRRDTDGVWVCRLCLRSAQRRYNRRRRADDEVEVVDIDAETSPPVLVVAPPPSGKPAAVRHLTPNGPVLGSTACWCGLNSGHDWPHKHEGAPHPRSAEAS